MVKKLENRLGVLDKVKMGMTSLGIAYLTFCDPFSKDGKEIYYNKYSDDGSFRFEITKKDGKTTSIYLYDVKDRISIKDGGGEIGKIDDCRDEVIYSGHIAKGGMDSIAIRCDDNNMVGCKGVPEKLLNSFYVEAIKNFYNHMKDYFNRKK